MRLRVAVVAASRRHTKWVGQCLPARLLSGKPRGYAFVEFEHKKDMKEAYKVSEGSARVEQYLIIIVD